MKVFVVTFYRNNYGSCLQAFALQSKLKECGYDTYLVMPSQKKRDKRPSGLTIIKAFFKKEPNYSIYKRIRRKIEGKIYCEKNRKLFEFVKSNAKLISYEECLKRLDDSTILLSGSDQVWNILNGPISDFFLCNFGNENTKRLSYAASIGLSDLSESQIKYYINALKLFKIISFREKRAFDLLSSVLDKEVRVDVDPTLLYSKEFWDNYCSQRLIDYKYVFVYMLRPDKQLIETARLLAKSLNLKIVYMGQYNYHYAGIKSLNTEGIGGFLSAIKFADVVITNSFHGTLFSVIYGKKFASKRITSTASRVESFLSQVNLYNHIIDNPEEYRKALTSYNKELVWAEIGRMKEKSIAYLNSMRYVE